MEPILTWKEIWHIKQTSREPVAKTADAAARRVVEWEEARAEGVKHNRVIVGYYPQPDPDGRINRYGDKCELFCPRCALDREHKELRKKVGL